MLGIDLSQILLHLFNTVLLFAGLYFLLYKPVLAFMKKREAYYQEMDEKAEAKLKSAEEQETAYKEKMSQLDVEMEAKRQQMNADLDQEREARTSEARQEAENILEKARTEAKREREQILENVQGDITLMVEDAAQKSRGKTSVGGSYDSFLDEVEGSTSDGEQ